MSVGLVRSNSSVGLAFLISYIWRIACSPDGKAIAAAGAVSKAFDQFSVDTLDAWLVKTQRFLNSKQRILFNHQIKIYRSLHHLTH
jgi:hypothetical protein